MMCALFIPSLWLQPTPYLLSRSSRNCVSKSSQAATSPMVTMRKPTQKMSRRAPMMTDPVLVEHLKQQLSTTAILINFQFGYDCAKVGCIVFREIVPPYFIVFLPLDLSQLPVALFLASRSNWTRFQSKIPPGNNFLFLPQLKVAPKLCSTERSPKNKPIWSSKSSINVSMSTHCVHLVGIKIEFVARLFFISSR